MQRRVTSWYAEENHGVGTTSMEPTQNLTSSEQGHQLHWVTYRRLISFSLRDELEFALCSSLKSLSPERINSPPPQGNSVSVSLTSNGRRWNPRKALDRQWHIPARNISHASWSGTFVQHDWEMVSRQRRDQSNLLSNAEGILVWAEIRCCALST